MRILNQQMTQLQRAFGNIISVLAVKLIPYIQVAIRLLTDLANKLAEMWGFELPEIDYSGMEKGITGLSDDADNATDSVNKTVKAVQRLAGFDEINVLKSAKEDADDTVDALSNNFDLGIDLPEYDFLQGVTNSTEELYQKAKAWLKELYNWWKKHKKIIESIAKILVGLWAVNKIKNFINWIKQIASPLTGLKKKFTDAEGNLTRFGKALGTIAGISLAGFGSYNLFYELTKGTGDWISYLTEATSLVAGLSMSWIFGGGKGLALGVITAGLSGLVGWVNAVRDATNEALERLMAAEWYTGGVKITEAAKIIEDYMSKLSEPEQKLLADAKTTESIKSNIEDISKNIDTMFLKLGNADSVDISAIEKIKGAFDDLATTTNEYIEKNKSMLEVYIASNAELLNGMGVDASNLLTILDEGFGKTTSKVEEIQAKIAEITSKSVITDDDRAKLKDLQQSLLEISGVKYDSQTEEINNFMRSIESLSSITINPENIDTAYSKLTELSSKYGETLKTLDEAKEEALRAINIGDYSEEQKQSLINAINSIYDIKEQDLSKAYSAIENIAQNVKNAFSETFRDIYAYTPPENYSVFSLFNDKQYEEDAKKAADKIVKTYKDKYGSAATDAVEYMNEQIALASGKTIGEVKKSVKKSADESKNVLGAAFSGITNYALSKLFTNSDVQSALQSTKNKLTEYWNQVTTKSKASANESAVASNKSYWEKITNAFGQSASTESEKLKTSFWGNVDKVFADESKAEQTSRSFWDVVSNKINSLGDFLNINPVTVPVELDYVIKNATDNLIIGALASMHIPGFASGGLVNADLFYANENGKAEFISSIGNRPAVANQQQMRSEIRQGVKEGMAEALRSQTGANGDIYVFIDSDQIAARIERRAVQRSKMNGGR
jgi:hypothetical protein